MTEVSNDVINVINDLHGKALLNYHLLAHPCQNGTILAWLYVRGSTSRILLQHAKANSTDIGSDPAGMYYFVDLYSFNTEVLSISTSGWPK